jgi:hypothetical protein
MAPGKDGFDMDYVNPYVRPGSNKVDNFFKSGGLMPWLGHPFDDAEQMRQSFDQPEKLEIVEVEGMQCLKLKGSGTYGR